MRIDSARRLHASTLLDLPYGRQHGRVVLIHAEKLTALPPVVRVPDAIHGSAAENRLCRRGIVAPCLRIVCHACMRIIRQASPLADRVILLVQSLAFRRVVCRMPPDLVFLQLGHVLIIAG